MALTPAIKAAYDDPHLAAAQSHPPPRPLPQSAPRRDGRQDSPVRPASARAAKYRVKIGNGRQGSPVWPAAARGRLVVPETLATAGTSAGPLARAHARACAAEQAVELGV